MVGRNPTSFIQYLYSIELQCFVHLRVMFESPQVVSVLLEVLVEAEEHQQRDGGQPALDPLLQRNLHTIRIQTHSTIQRMPV